MPQQIATATENNFTKGLITEATGLNFPENAATDTDNCIFTLVGDVTRREGINTEVNGIYNAINRSNSAVAMYKWNNAGGDGETQVVVEHVGIYLFFYVSSAATVNQPLTGQLLASYVTVSNFTASGATFDPTIECQFSDGNGYLFVYHPDCDPFYCTYVSGTVTGAPITIQIRDFTGIPETGLSVNTRPSTLSQEHLYNLVNQGWTAGNPWQGHATSFQQLGVGVSNTFTVQSGLGATNGDSVTLHWNGLVEYPNTYVGIGMDEATATVTSYSGTTLTVLVNTLNPAYNGNIDGTFSGVPNTWTITPISHGYINTWFTDIGNYPSNADVWWYFKDDTNLFNPTTTISNVTLATGTAPQGHIILNAFNQQRTLVSVVSGITNVVTTLRPRTGAWFQGRVWYTGVDAQQPATGDAGYYTWTENLYFSQIVQTPSDFGSCYQTNDPTSEDLFDLLPTDGGVITIQGSGSVYKLFPIQNGMLVFAANGIWFITGSQGIGFSASDYTITKISSVRSISPYSYVDVNGLPMFWNEEGIYSVEPTQGGALQVNPITVGTILTYYNEIPRDSLKYARGDYDPIGYIVQWVFKSTQETSVTDRYTFDKVLNFNTYNKAFYPYSVDTSSTSINGIIYVSSPGGINAPDATLKYASSSGTQMSFADEHDTTYVDWGSINYDSYFVTGYRLRGQGIKKFQPQYIQIYSRQNGAASAYKIQGIWDYANDPSSGRWSSMQVITNALTRFDTVFRRHKIRGHGFVLQFKLQSVDGMPFDIQGWATVDTVNTGT